METNSTNTEQTQLDKLHIGVELLAAHPHLPRPCVWAYSSGNVNVTWQLMHDDDAKDNQRDVAQQIIRTIGGHWRKNPWQDRFDFKREYDGIKLEIYANRDQVCERRIVGTESVTIPAVPAVAAQPAQPERTEVREIVEWDCSPVLAPAEAVS